MSRGPAARLGVVGVAVALGLGACGIPTDDSPRVIADETTEPAVTTVVPGTVPVEVVLVEAETSELATRQRSVGGGPGPASALAALLMVPSDAEVADGLTTAIPPTTTALGVVEVDGVWVVDMNSDWGALQGQNALLAYAQVVLTLTRAGAEQVRFTVDEVPVVDAPTDTGGREVLTAADYADLDPA